MIRRDYAAKSNARWSRTGSDEYHGLRFVCFDPCDETKGGPRLCDGPFRSAYLGSTFKVDLKRACRRWCSDLGLRVDAYSPSLGRRNRESLASVALEK
jgi:hypothetical protein